MTKRIEVRQNEGRAMARSALLEWITREASRVVEPNEDQEFWLGYRTALGDARKLIEQTDPLEIWEVDCRKEHKQWGNKGRLAVVKLDGEKLQFCVAADTVAGVALVHRRADNGKPVYNGGVFAMDTLFGRVEIVEPVVDVQGSLVSVPATPK